MLMLMQYQKFWVTMMTDYIIDENVIMESIHGQKPNNKNADAESELMYKILSGEDHIILNKEIEKKIYKIPKKILAKYSEKSLNNQIYPRLLKIIRDPSRTTFVDGIKIDFEGQKKCDKQFVSVAIQSNGILITADNKLKESLKKGGPVVSKCKCMNAKEVLSYIEK